MRVKVEYTAVLKLDGVACGSWVDIPPSCTVADLLRQLGVPAQHTKYVSVAINGRLVRATHRLQDGDAVLLSLPMGGG